VLKFNGFTIKVYGNVLTLDAVHVNGDDDGDKKRLSVKVKLGNAVNLKYAHPMLGDNKWTLNFPTFEAFIQITVPLGVNSETISWECDKSSEGTRQQWVLSVNVQ